MKKWFSAKIYIHYLKRLKYPFIALCALISVLNIYCLPYRSTKEINSTNAFLGTWVVFPFVLFAVLWMFSYLGRKEGEDRIFSLPQKSLCVFLSFSASIYTASALGVVVANTLCYVALPFLELRLDFIDFLIAIVNHVVCTVAFVSIVLFCRVVAKGGFTALIYSGILCFCPRIVTYVLTYAVDELSMMVDTFYGFTRYFILGYSPFYIAFSMKQIAYEDKFLLFVLSLEAVVLLMGAAFFYCRRAKSKDVYRFYRISHRVFLWLFALPLIFAALAFGLIEKIDIGATILLLLGGCVIVCFTADIIRTKSFRKTLVGLATLVVPAAIAVMILGVASVSAKVIDQPVEAEEIKCVAWLYEFTDWDYTNLSFKDRIIKRRYGKNVYEENAIGLVADAMKNTSKTKERGFHPMRITLKNGEVIYRTVNFGDKYMEAFDILTRQRKQEIWDTFPKYEATSIRKNMSHFAEIRIMSSLKKEYKSLSYDEKVEYLSLSHDVDEECFIIKVYLEDGYDRLFYITKTHTPKTFELFEELADDYKKDREENSSHVTTQPE